MAAKIEPIKRQSAGAAASRHWWDADRPLRPPIPVGQ
jgi:hypothetical protein